MPGIEVLAPFAKWGALVAIVMGGVSLVLHYSRKRGEAEMRAKIAETAIEQRREVSRAQARSRSSGDSPAVKFRRMRKRRED